MTESKTTIVITGIGGSIGIDVARSLRRDSNLRLIGCECNPYAIEQTRGLVDEIVELPRADRGAKAFVDALYAVLDRVGADFVFVNPDVELEAIAEVGRACPIASSMPPVETVAITLDKAMTVAKTGLTDEFPATFDLACDGDLNAGFAALKAPLWLRSSVGAGGRGSLSVETAAEAQAWIDYWARREKKYHWVLQEFLPGANINWTGVYRNGELVVSAAMERLRYFLGDSAASGVSGQVSDCETVAPATFLKASDRVVRALDATPHGVYSVDLRADRTGRHRVTEVNPRLAGRPWLYSNAGCNVALATVRALALATGPGDAVDDTGLRTGVHLYRQLDIEPVIAG